ncbi:MAG: hypothetical protein HYX32_06115 [Actinobacteria bacterium]|nr:hypothetical protein [Actinomycetota bacterium]
MTTADEITRQPWPSQPPPEPPLAGHPGAAPPPAAAPLPGSYPGSFPASSTGWGQGRPPPAPPTGASGKRSLVITAAVLVVIALLGGAFLAGSKLGKPDEAASTAPSTTNPTTSPSTTSRPQPSTTKPPATGSPSTTPPAAGGSSPGVDEAAVKAEVAKLQKFIEQDRGLKYKSDVNVTVLNETAFKEAVLQEFDQESEQLRKQGQLLQALGLIPANADPVAIQKNLLGEGVLGFYEPKTKVLVVKGDKIGPFFREIAVHELTHALDDQNFGLDRPEFENATDDRAWSWLALIEGNARRVEFDYVRQLSDSDKQQLTTEMMQMSGSGLGAAADIPLALAMIVQAPYDYGEPFVRDVLQRGGQPGLDQAFSQPPSTSEQILQPDKFASKEGAKSVEAPPAGGDVVDQGTLGEIMTGFLVNGEVSMDDLLNKALGGALDGSGDPNDPLGGLGALLGGSDDPTKLNEMMSQLLGKADKVKNWGGDRFVLWNNGSDVCIRVDWVMDSGADVLNLRTQLKAWAQKDGKGKIEELGDKTRMTRCASGAAPSTGGNRGPGV